MVRLLPFVKPLLHIETVPLLIVNNDRPRTVPDLHIHSNSLNHSWEKSENSVIDSNLVLDCYNLGLTSLQYHLHF